MSSVVPTPARPMIVEGRVAPALFVQAVRMAFIMGGSGIAGHLVMVHPTVAAFLADPAAIGGAGVALANAAWSLYARAQLCGRLKHLAQYVDSSIAVVRR